MKKTFKFASAAIAIVAAASCAKELNTIENGKIEENLVKVTFSAAFEDTKAYLEGNQVCWEEGDSIAVWDGTKARSFKAVSVSGNQATFVGEVEATASNFAVVSPYTSFKEFVEDTIKFNLPATQYVGKNKSAKDVLVSVAQTNDLSAGISLKNAVSLVKFALTGEGITSLVLTGADKEPIVGSAYYLSGEVVQQGGTSKLTVLPESGTLAAGTYYAAVLPSTLSNGLTAIYGTASEKGKVSTAKAVVFEMNGGKDLGTLDGNPSAVKVPNILTTTNDLLAFGEMMPYYVAGETVKLGNDISLEGQTWNGDTFYGTLDGQGYSISHVNIEASGVTAFIPTLYGTVKDIKFGTPGDGSLLKCTAKSGSAVVVAPFGAVKAGGQLTNVENYATIEVSGSCTANSGGICSSYASALPASGCKNHGNVIYSGSPSSGTPNIGGVIANISGAAKIENCENDAIICFKPSTCPSTYNMGGITGYCSVRATFKGCKNSGTVKIGNEVTTPKNAGHVGGILGYNQGVGADFVECENSGNVTCEASAMNKSAVYLGGIVGQNNSKSTTGISLTDCTNSGDLSAATVNGSGAVAIGGMIGYRNYSSADAVATLTRCKNLGTIIDKGIRSATGTSSYLGGMVGWNELSISLVDCENGMEGEELGTVTKSSPSGSITYFIAISGMIAWQTSHANTYSKQTVSINGCHNYATLSTVDEIGSTYVYLGSMIAGNEPIKVSGSDKYYSVTIDNCVNDGALTNFATGTDQVRMGGFIGDGANYFTLKNSTNNGEISSSCAVTKANVQYRLGGFVGSITKGAAGKHVFTDLVNKGNVSASNTSESVTANSICAGGITGFMGIASNTYTRCTSNAAIAASGATTTYVKAIIGDTSRSCTLDECALAGSCNGEEITSENFSAYVWGTDLATPPTVTEKGTKFYTE